MENWSVPRFADPVPATPAALWGQIGRLAFETGADTHWVFRGLSSYSYSTAPSLIRRIRDAGEAVTEEVVRAAELQLLKDARDWGIGIESTGVADDMHVLALMQHHGLPTRLLDVTANPLTALYFACRRSKKERDGGEPTHGAVLAFNVTDTPVYDSGGPRKQTWAAMTDPTGSYWQHALDQSKQDESWFVVRPSTPDHRMRAQEGQFLCSAVPQSAGSPASLIDGIYPPSRAGQAGTKLLEVPGGAVGNEALPFSTIWAVIVPADMKDRLRRVLRGTFNRTDRTMFPDLMGLRDAVGNDGLHTDAADK